MKNMIIKTNSQDIPIVGYSVTYDDLGNVVSISYKNPTEIQGGFYIYTGNELLFDASRFLYRWDVVDHKPNTIFYTDSPTYRQTDPFAVRDPNVEVEEQVDPLTNEELTNCVADLMYQLDKMKLGLEE